MSNNTYVGRHRPATKPGRGRQFIVPLALLSSTVAAGLIVRDAGASPLSAEAAAMKNVSNSVAGLGLVADADALAVATADRGNLRASRDGVRAEAALGLAASSAAEAGADAAKEALERIAAEKAAAEKEAAAKAAAAKKKAEAERKRRLALAQRWIAPFHNYTLTSGYGWRWGKMHPAQDLAAPTGTPVYSMSSGTVIFSGWSNEGYGYMVKIRYWDGTVSWYAHNSRLVVSIGEQVSPGQRVAYSGNSGNSTGPHLHLEIHPGGGAAVVPRSWLAARGIYL
ncbi:M23 family metallopeptidase [Intrasporangium calvum]|uniref:M23 family metallopeptidase n=1 Tax=Intrasporangium calvum TaxID=53358 RepID=A0ABT5GGN0_9MICO|nr:M23 family metallopeptidase [Intrasporangium calvum]MDC5696985.1 M23 family metallopeptidase [Intrasporangium calvum]